MYNNINFFCSFLEYIEVGQTELINEIYKDNFLALSELNESLIHLYFKKIIHPKASLGFGGHHLRYLTFI